MAKNFLTRLDKKHLEKLRTIGKQAQSMDARAYIVGGIVRDLVLGCTNQDFDCVIEGDAIALAKRLKEMLSAEKIISYPSFGTATLTLSDGLRLDFATARSEVYSSPGALPKVKPGSMQEDLFRRDFTINAMAIAIDPDHWGELLDPYGGLSDLEKGYVRVLHERSFIDDPTRLLRALRFKDRLHFRLEPKTARWFKSAVEHKASQTVSLKRYFTEFRKMLQECDPLAGLKTLEKFHALGPLGQFIKIDVALLKRIQANKDSSDAGGRESVYLKALTRHLSREAMERFATEVNLTRTEKKNLFLP